MFSRKENFIFFEVALPAVLCNSNNAFCLQSLTTIDFRLAGVSFINLVHFSHSTLVLLFTLWKDKCWLKLRRNFFCQNNTVMLTYTNNHSPVTLLWRCSWDSNEKQNSKSFFNYEDYYEVEVYFFSLRCWFLHMTSLAVTLSTL